MLEVASVSHAAEAIVSYRTRCLSLDLVSVARFDAKISAAFSGPATGATAPFFAVFFGVVGWES